MTPSAVCRVARGQLNLVLQRTQIDIRAADDQQHPLVAPRRARRPLVSAASGSAAAGSTASRSSLPHRCAAPRGSPHRRAGAPRRHGAASASHAMAPMRRAPSESAAMPDTSTSTGAPASRARYSVGASSGSSASIAAAALEPRRDAGDQAAAADADERAIRHAGVVFDFGGQRRRADHDLALVVGVHQQRAALAPGARGSRPAHRHSSAPPTVTTAPSSRELVALGAARRLGHEDLAAHAERLRRHRDGDAGVAARGDDDAGRRASGWRASG